MDTHTKTYSILRDIRKRSKVTSNLLKETLQNPGRGLRKITAGTVKDPITGTAILATQLQPLPGVGTATIAATPALAATSKTILPKSTQRKLRQTSKEIMSDQGKTRASRFGQKLEYHTNKSLMSLSNLASKFPM